MRSKFKIIHVFKFLVLGTLFLTVLGFGIRELWNCLIPDLFHGPVITFWQGLGLCLLGKLLFGWHPGGGFKRGRAPWADNRAQWAAKMRERFESMTPEDREKMRERLNRCGGPRFGRWKNWYDEDTEKKDPSSTQETRTNI